MESLEFGTRLRELRKEAGLSQRDLANRVGVDFTYISKLENGTLPPPSEKVILRLTEVLNADRDELITLAGRIPSDIADMLKSQDALRLLRSESLKKKIGATKKKERASITKNPFNFTSSYKKLYRVALAAVLLLAVGASLWFAGPLPVRALNITVTNPASGTLGSTYSFTVQVDIADNELLPVQSINLYIYKSDNRATYEATLASVPTNSATKSYTSAQTGGGSANVTATPDANWAYVWGTPYVAWQGGGYTFTPSPSYGYGYSVGTGTTSITYAVSWTPPSNWPASTYKIEAKITSPDNKTFITTSSAFTLSVSSAGGGGIIPTVLPTPPGTTDISANIDSSGVFTADVTAQSADGNVSLTIEAGTQGLTQDGTPLSEITIQKETDPPPPPEASNVIGLVYDFGPSGATFGQPITITLNYDELQIPPDVDEASLVLAYWDGEMWVELPSVVDTANNIIAVEITHFTLFTIIAPPSPAAFTVSSLLISPSEVAIGEKVTIRVFVTNSGDIAGSYTVTLKIDNVVVDTKDVTLDSLGSQEIIFTTSRDKAGTYNVTVNSQEVTLVVRAAPAPPAPPVPAPPTPAPAPAPPAPPVPAPPAPPVAPVNWWLMGGIIAAVIIIGAVVWQVVVRQRAWH